MDTLPFALVDAFEAGPGSGNPAAVVLLKEEASPEALQAMAAELAQAETAFLRALDAPHTWSLRWFTPLVEVELCGHATLAAASFLAAQGLLPAGQAACFHTLSGPLWARWAEAPSAPLPLPPALGSRWRFALDFPAEPPELVGQGPPELLAALGCVPRWVGRNRLTWVVELATEAEVRALRPDLAALTLFAQDVVVCALGDGPLWDVVSRYFSPAQGILEDHVTGSAHAALGPHFAPRLGRKALRCWQASPRGGSVGLRLEAGGRVALEGSAKLVLVGHILSPGAWERGH